MAKALDALASRAAERVFVTGDIVDGVGSADRCCALLRAHGAVVVRGNHDRWFVAGTARELSDATASDGITFETRRMLADLPEMVEIDTVKGRALLCHGIGPNDMAKVTPDDFGYAIDWNEDSQNVVHVGRYRWLLNGHSHRRMVRRFGELTFINAGTLKRDHQPCFLELDFERGSVLVFSFNPAGTVHAPAELLCPDDDPDGEP